METNSTNSTEILLVDDDLEILETTTKSLNAIGFNVITATDGEKALEIFKERLNKNKPIKVIITDMLMPNMNGMDLIKNIYKQRQQTAFIVFSAYRDLKEDLELFPCIRRVHIKPINLQNVVQDLITIFTNREWELVKTENIEQTKIHKNAYIAIQKLLKHLI